MGQASTGTHRHPAMVHLPLEKSSGSDIPVPLLSVPSGDPGSSPAPKSLQEWQERPTWLLGIGVHSTRREC